MKEKKLTIVAFLIVLTFSCGKQKTQLEQRKAEIPKRQQVEISTSTIISGFEKYVYDGLAYRDPFVPLSGEKVAKAKLGQSEDAFPPPLGSLQLKAFIVDKQDKIALFSSPYGSYIFVNGKLYDRQNRLVKGYTGKIIFDVTLGKPKSVILFNSENESKQFSLSE